MKKLLYSLKSLLIICLTIIANNVYSHAVQLAYGVGCNGNLRLWVEHWHTTENPSSTTMTITFNGNTFTSAPGGAVYGTPVGSLPGTPTTFAACPNANAYNDWVYYDFNIPCNTQFTLTVVSGNTVFTQDDCGMMPATVTGIVPCIPLTVTTTGASICPGGSANLSAVAGGFPGGTFVWNPGGIQGDNITVNPNATTTYTVSYTSPDGCTKTATAVVTVLPVPTVSVTSVSICLGYSGTITATGTPPGGTFSWSPLGGTSQSMTDNPTQTESYTVTYTAPNGCTNTASGTITVKPDPQPFITVVNPIICSGQNQNATLIANNGGFPISTTYSWAPGGSPSSVLVVSPTVTTTYTVTVTMNGCVATETATITVEDPPTVNIAAVSVCAGQSGTLTAVPSIGGGTYLWAPGGATTASITVTPASTTTYTVSYTSPAGCIGTGTGTITVKPVPNVTTNSPTICNGSNTTLVATPSPTGGSYSWNPGGGTGQTMSVSPGTTTTYTVTYTLNGCPKTATSVVTVNPLPSVTATSSTVCNGTAATLSATPSSGGGTYSWAPGGATTQSITVTPGTTTTYTVTYTLNGCSGTATGTVNVVPVPAIAVPPASVCNGTPATLTANPSLPGGTYSWTPGGATTQSITVSPSVPTTYTVTYTLNGCSNTATGLVNINTVPTVTATSATVCNGIAATLTANPSPSGGTFSWSPGGGTGASVSVTPSTTTTYTVTYTLNACSGTATGTVNVNPSPTVTSSSATVCNGTSATLTATPSSGGGTYLWMPGGSTNSSITVTPSLTTTYTVTYTLNGCSGTATGLVTVNPVPTVSVNNATVCNGSSATLTASPSISGGSYLWSPGGATAVSITDAPGTTTTYTVTYTLNGCSNTGTGTINVNPVPTVTSTSITICNGSSGNLSATPSITGGTYSWNPGGATGATISVSPGITTTYTVTYTLNGCSNTGTGLVTVDPIPTVTANSVSVCNGSTATITATPSVSGGSYLWTPGGATTASISVSPSATTTYTVSYTLNGCTGTATGTVTIDPIPTVAVSSSSICNGGTATITATPSVTGGTYLWNPGGSTNASISVSPAVTTTYTVTYTSPAGCTNTGTGTVSIGLVPTVLVNSTTVCNGSTGTLTATPSVAGGTFLWNPTGGTNASLNDTPGTTTTYTVTYSLNGCSSTGSGTITVDPVPTVTATSDAVCNGTSGTLTATPSLPGGTYLWSPGGGTTATITDAPATTTTYTVTYTLNNCSNTATAVITVNPIPTVTATSDTICNGSSGTLTATPSLPGGTYLWTPGGVTTAVMTDAPSTTTTYTVTYTLNNCSNTATGTITVNVVPSVTATSDTICNGASATITATGLPSGGNYLWTPTGAATSNLTDSPTAPLVTTSYTYTVSYTLNNCSNTATGTILVNPVPTVSVNSSTVCNGTSATLIATPSLSGGTYLWSPGGATTSSITDAPTTTTTYTVTYTLNGCSSTGSGTITVNPVPTVTTTSDTICNGSSGTLTSTPSLPGGTYLWTPGGAGTSSITDAPTTTTTYTVTYTLNGCSNTATATIVVNPVPTVTATSDTVCNGTSGTLTATPSLPGGTYLWSPGGATTASITDAPSTTTTYTVTYTLDGCSNTATGTILVNPVPVVTANPATVCNGIAATVTANPSLLGGTYLWSPGGATTASVSVTPATTTTYTVSYTLDGCTATATSLVTINIIPTVTATSTTVCNGTSATLTATPSAGGGTYLWTPTGGTNATITDAPIVTTTYTVTYTLNGCSGTATGTINVDPVPTVIVNSDTVCEGTSATLIATPSISGGTYLWSFGGAITASITDAPSVTTTYTVSYTLNGCSNTATGTIVVNPVPSVTATSATVCNGTAATLTATPSLLGGTYLWTPGGATTASFTDTPGNTTIYTVIYELNGCSDTTTGTITVNPVPNVSSTSDVVCDGIAGTLTATPSIAGGTYLWMPGGATTATISYTPNITTTYTVTYTLNGCSTTATGTITVNPIPTVTVNSATICNGSSVLLIATPSITGGTYAWNVLGGSTSQSITVSPSVTTSYAVIYTVSGCSGTGTGTVTVTPVPSANITSINVCNGTPGTLTATTNISGGTYLWTPGGATTASITVLPTSTTTYTVSYSASNCVTTASGTITVNPVPTVSSNSSTICYGQSTTLTATPSITGGTYSWAPSGGTAVAETVTPLVTSTYTVTYSLNGCSATGTGTVVVLPGINLAAAGSATICSGSSTPLSSIAGAGNGGPYTYSWSPAAGLNNPNINNPIASPVVTTTYTVTVSDNCSSPVTATVVVTVAPIPNPVLAADITEGCMPLCVNFTDVTTVSSGTITNWYWDFGDGNSSTTPNPKHCYNTAGVYSVSLTATSSNQCSNTITYNNLINVHPLPVADFTMPTTVSVLSAIVPFTDLSTGANSWSWSFGDMMSGVNDTSSLQNPYHTYSEPGTYCITLAVQNQYGCADTTEKCLLVEPEFSFYIPNAFSPNNDGKNDVFMGKGENIIKYEMLIFDRWGNEIFKTEDLAIGWDGKANKGSRVAQIDVYVYVVNLVDFRGGEHTYRGTVTLVK